MQKLVTGIHDFQSKIFEPQKALFTQLAQGQHPLALFITCSDSRIDPNLLTQTQPGELFVMRNAGNIVPTHGTASGGEAATIEYAVVALQVKDIIVCGHSFCGAMSGLLHPETLGALPAVRDWLQHAKATARAIKENHASVTEEDERLRKTVEENVLVQLENLQTHPSVADAVARGALELHGWTYQFETGHVCSYDPQEGQFLRIEPRVDNS